MNTEKNRPQIISSIYILSVFTEKKDKKTTTKKKKKKKKKKNNNKKKQQLIADFWDVMVVTLQ